MKNLNLFCILFFLVVFFNPLISLSQEKFKVTLDAGHGDHDFGAVYHGHIEKNIALAVVLKVGAILEKNPYIEVNYTRKTDVFIDLIERAEIANRANASIFVSIHCNASKNLSAEGSETFVMGMTKNASNLEAAKKENSVITLEKDYQQKYNGFDPNSPETLIGLTIMQEEFLENSIALAGKVQDNFRNYLGQKDRGVKQAPFMVLHKAYMPRVLIEIGFISNPDEGARLNTDEGQLEVAQSIADAIVNYKKEFFGEGVNEPIVEKPTPRIVQNTIETPIAVDSAIVDTPKIEEKIVLEAPKIDIDYTGIVFKVQLFTSSKKLEPNSQAFKGLANISETIDTSVFKYYYGETNSYETAKKHLLEAKNKGFSSAFLIALKNGKSINIKDAIK